MHVHFVLFENFFHKISGFSALFLYLLKYFFLGTVSRIQIFFGALLLDDLINET